MGAPVTATLPAMVPVPLALAVPVPVMVAVPVEHWLAEELPELPGSEQQPLDDPNPEELPLDPLQEAEFDSRAPGEPRPSPEATSGRTVTNRTKLAAAITANRAHNFHRFIAKSPIRHGCHAGRPG